MGRGQVRGLEHAEGAHFAAWSARARWMCGSTRRIWLATFSVYVLLYGSTAHWYGIVNADSVAAAWPGWAFAHHGTFHLEAIRGLPRNPWFGDAAGHLVSNRMPGVVLIGVPAQWLLAPFHPHALTAAVATAVVATAAAMANLTVVAIRLGSTAAAAAGATAAIALGTGFWNNASAELWTHGPDALWLSLAFLALTRDRLWMAGVAFAPAMATRPHLALAAAGVGFWLAVRRRSLRPLWQLGLPASCGIVGLLAWNRWLFGHLTLEGGYTYAVDKAVTSSRSSVRPFVESVAGTLLSPLHGLLLYSPFVLLALVAALRGFSKTPDWCQACFCGGLAYQLAQWRINGFTGGAGFYSYRLPLELLLLAMPAAVVGYRRWRAQRPNVEYVMRILVGISTAIHLIGVYWYAPFSNGDLDPNPWTTWGVSSAATSRGMGGFVLAAVAGSAAVAAAMIRLPPTFRTVPAGAVTLRAGASTRDVQNSSERRRLGESSLIIAAAPSALPARPTRGLPGGE